MTDSHSDSCCSIDAKTSERRRKILIIVFWINSGMFVVEFAAGWFPNSSALLGDSLDMLGDAATYGISLYV